MNKRKQEILDAVKDDLEAIEKALHDHLHPHLELVSQIANHILFSGGKRLRPLLTILSARLCRYEGTFVTTLSCVFEYLHAATLLHDDIVDAATLRRGKPVAHLTWENSTVVLVGDFLLARSVSIAAQTGLPEIVEIIAYITENMSQGEIRQMLNKNRSDLTEAEYLDVIRSKTAVLFQGACRASALIAQASSDEETALANYGYNLGLAFQMADDLLDYTTDSAALGKEVGADLKEGKVTLPVIYALKKADPETRRQMEAIIINKDFNSEDFETLRLFLKKYKGIEYTKKQAAKYAADAKNALAVFEPSSTKQILIDVADYALLRKS
jgi:octaprenyl-diphosphate synthase